MPFHNFIRFESCISLLQCVSCCRGVYTAKGYSLASILPAGLRCALTHFILRSTLPLRYLLTHAALLLFAEHTTSTLHVDALHFAEHAPALPATLHARAHGADAHPAARAPAVDAMNALRDGTRAPPQIHDYRT